MSRTRAGCSSWPGWPRGSRNRPCAPSRATACGSRGGPVRDAPAPGGRRARTARLLAGAGRQRQPGLLPRPQRAGRRQRDAPEHADALPVYNTGFPIFYDAKIDDINTTASSSGAPASASGTSAGPANEWRRMRSAGTSAASRPTLVCPARPTAATSTCSGARFPVALRGPRQVGVGRQPGGPLRAVRLDAQFVEQDIAKLVRKGFDIEVRLSGLPGLFLMGETPVVNWIQPVCACPSSTTSSTRP